LSGIIQSRHSRRAVPMKRSQWAFACGAPTGVFNTCRDIDRRASSQKLAPVDKRRKQNKGDSRGVVRAVRSGLVLDITGELFSQEEVFRRQLRTALHISRTRRNESVRRANAVLSTSAGS